MSALLKVNGMSGNLDELSKLAERLDDAKSDLRLAATQCTKPVHLETRIVKAAAQASRSIAYAIDLGLADVWPELAGMLLLYRNGKGCSDDGAMKDETAFHFWRLFVCSYMRSKHPTLTSDAGEFDFPRLKNDDRGKVLNRDGKPPKIVAKKDPQTGKTVEYVDGERALETDDFDEVDWLERFRVVANEWADICEFAAESIRKDATTIKPTRKPRRRKLEWLSKALICVNDHPEWSNTRIAEEVGVSKSTLSRNDTFRQAAKFARDTSPCPKRGHYTVDPDTNLKDVEAFCYDDRQLDD